MGSTVCKYHLFKSIWDQGLLEITPKELCRATVWFYTVIHVFTSQSTSVVQNALFWTTKLHLTIHQHWVENIIRQISHFWVQLSLNHS